MPGPPTPPVGDAVTGAHGRVSGLKNSRSGFRHADSTIPRRTPRPRGSRLSSSAGMWQAMRWPRPSALLGRRRLVADRAHASRAARAERAAAHGVGRAGQRALEQDALALRVGVRDRHRGEQRLGVRMVGRREDVLDAPVLHHLAQVHDRDVVGEVADHGEVVRDEDQRGLAGRLQLVEQVDDRRLDRDVQRRDRLVGDDDVRVAGQRPRDGDPLLLAARELVGLRARPARPGASPRRGAARPPAARPPADSRSQPAERAGRSRSPPCGWGSGCCRGSGRPSGASA